jgi:hypothetical protein
MKSIAKLVSAALLGAAAVAVTTTSASAYIVCNHEGECWHTAHPFRYPPNTVYIHPEGWSWRANEHYRWHEHDGRGFWRGGIWIKL